MAFPGELDGGLAVPLDLSVVDAALDTVELELSGPIRVESEETLDLLVHVLLFPGFHPGDPPATGQTALSLATLLTGGATLRHGFRRLGVPGEARDDAVSLLGGVVGVVEFPGHVASDDQVVARQEPVVDDPILERQQDRPTVERKGLLDDLVERVAQR